MTALVNQNTIHSFTLTQLQNWQTLKGVTEGVTHGSPPSVMIFAAASPILLFLHPYI